MFLQIAQRGEYLLADGTVERFAVVQPLVRPQPVPGVESFPAAALAADVRFHLRVDADVDLLAVGRQEGFGAALLGALKLVFT